MQHYIDTVFLLQTCGWLTIPPKSRRFRLSPDTRAPRQGAGGGCGAAGVLGPLNTGLFRVLDSTRPLG